MIMNVMLRSMEKARTVAAWSKGEKWKTLALTDAEFDLAIVELPAPEGLSLRPVVLAFAGLPYTARFVVAGPVPSEVQTFRFKNHQGEERFALVCAGCGCLRLVGAEDLRDIGTAPCESCLALPIGPRCPRGHNWGTCPECSPSIEEHSRSMQRAFDRQKCHRLAEDGQPTKAGPSAPSLGSAEGGGPSGVLPVMPGVDGCGVGG